MKLIIMRGVSGSGKSTVAREIAERTGAVVVSRDDLRFALFGRYVGVDEELITRVENEAIRKALGKGFDVVCDNTHIQHRSVNDKIKLAYEFDAEVEIKELVVDLSEALHRNAQRDRVVPVHVVERQFERYKPFTYTPLPTFEKYVPDNRLDGAYIFDIDGTLATKGDRGYFEWSKVGVDDVVRNVADVASTLYGLTELIIFSGRDAECFEETVLWLNENDVLFDQLYMREAGDQRADTIVKMEMFDKYVRGKYNVLGVFDDRPSVVRQWLKHDIPVFHVAPYAEDF